MSPKAWRQWADFMLERSDPCSLYTPEQIGHTEFGYSWGTHEAPGEVRALYAYLIAACIEAGDA